MKSSSDWEIYFLRKGRVGVCIRQLLVEGKYIMQSRLDIFNHLDGGPVIKTWDQEVCFLYGLRFELCGCSYDGHWRLTWSLTSRPVGLVKVRASWSEHSR